MIEGVEPTEDAVAELKFAALRNSIYHTKRRDRLERVSRLVNFLILLAGTAVATSFLTAFGIDEKINALVLGGATTVLAGLGLVYDFAVRAKDHEHLAKSFYELLSDILGTAHPSEEKLAEWRRRFSKVVSEEPPPLRALSALAHNEALQILDGDDAPILKVTWYERAFRNVRSYDGHIFPHIDPVSGKKPE